MSTPKDEISVLWVDQLWSIIQKLCTFSANTDQRRVMFACKSDMLWFLIRSAEFSSDCKWPSNLMCVDTLPILKKMNCCPFILLMENSNPVIAQSFDCRLENSLSWFTPVMPILDSDSRAWLNSDFNSDTDSRDPLRITGSSNEARLSNSDDGDYTWLASHNILCTENTHLQSFKKKL